MKKVTANLPENLQNLFDFYQITAQAEPAEENVIHLDGVIGLDVTANEVEEQLSSFGGKPVVIKMSGPGGFIVPGLRIHNLIREYSGHTEVRLMGYAASMTSYIPMAADKVTAHDNTIFMIHNAQGIAAGDHNAMQEGTDLTRRTSAMLAQAYVAKTGKPTKEIRKLMDEGSYFFGSEALEAGFVDGIIETGETKNKETAIAATNDFLSNCMARMKASVEAKKDIEQLAAMIGKIEPKPEPENKTTNHNGLLNISNNQNPAPKAEIKTEVNNMTLQELLAQNPAAMIEFKDEIKIATSSGFEACQTETKARITGASPYLGENSNYPQHIANKAAQVVTGELPLSALQSAVSGHDATIEALRSQGVIAESEALGNTPAQQSGSAEPENGITETNAQFDAMMAKRHPEKQAVA